MKMISAFNRWKDVFKRLAGRGIYPHELALLLDTSLRKFILSPVAFADRIHLSNNLSVLEIGSGPGYFSVEVANRIPGGKLVLFDIQHEMLLRCSGKLLKNNIQNAFLLRGNAGYLPIISESFDVVYLVTVLGEVTNPENCLIEINRILKGGGMLSISEMRGDSDFLSMEDLNKLVASVGFEMFEKHISKKGFTINYKKI
jgi:ubiquinone/menaquinone biosynthesis C-methylase UbiE